jgi:osmoprotectant transport system substrate-binding protein
VSCSVRTAALRCLVVTVMACAGCSSGGKTPVAHSALGDESMTITSFDFPESELLADLYGQALTASGFDVRSMPRLGPRELVLPALAQGLVELVPEYAGTALGFVSIGANAPVSNEATTYDELVKALSGSSLAALAFAPAQNANAIVIRRDIATRYQLSTISDVQRVASQLVFGGPPECPTRPLCLVGLGKTYGLAFKEFVPLDVGGPMTRQALEAGQVDVALLFTTDPSIARDGLVVLTDDRHLQPAENIVPLVNTEVVQHFGSRLVDVVDAVSSKLTTEVLRALNGQVQAGEPPSAVAAGWLTNEGLS